MSRQLDYTFQELPLLITGGFSAGLVNGSAIINYWPNGLWGIVEIYLDGCRRKSAAEIVEAVRAGARNVSCWDEKPIQLDRGTPLHSMIWERLETEWRPFVQDRVNEAIEAERAA